MPRPWLIRMRWLDLLFAHWPVDPAPLERLIPPQLELDRFEDQAWLGIVPFTMDDVAPRGVPAPGRFATFPELNVRTYVRRRDRPADRGVWFLSLDAASWSTVWGSRLIFHLPYVHARMSSRRDGDDVLYRSDRDDGRWPPVRFAARYRSTGPPALAEPGTFDEWATNRLRLFSVDSRRRLIHGDIAHTAWPLEPAEAELDAAELAASHGITFPGFAPRLRFARRLDVRGWLPVRSR
ncbi:MAG TPA: DUF2071 domain-containing protein [Candidatus Limnocylindrales bacterium]|nr:DUF2071 domain-containing protein [Candidatus Limnocylindrales bacterium]